MDNSTWKIEMEIAKFYENNGQLNMVFPHLNHDIFDNNKKMLSLQFECSVHL